MTCKPSPTIISSSARRKSPVANRSFARKLRRCWLTRGGGWRAGVCSRRLGTSDGVMRVACCVLRERMSMTFTDWMGTVPQELKGDPLWRMEVYRLSVFAADLAWPDVTKLITDKRTISLADQLYRAVGSTSANIAEGYGRQSGKDQARYYEYALGSAREAPNWYYHGRH